MSNCRAMNYSLYGCISLAPSSSGSGHLVFIQKIAGSNPAGVTKIMLVLQYPLNPTKNPIETPFGVDFTNDPMFKDFYTLFDNKHSGVDFKAPINTPAKSAFDGIVVRKEFHKGMGNVLGIRNGNILALYAHLNEFKVDLGDIVLQGQIIALTGNTGSATTGPHLHFELRDLSKKPLKNMVFDPPFNKEVKNYKKTFKYKVNNEHRPKTLEFLALAYFGNEKYWELIRDTNKLEKKKDEILDQDSYIIIPNYK